MQQRTVNLADPSYEPTDDDLRALASEAFADVARRRREALERLYREIAVLREAALARLAASEAAQSRPSDPHA